MELQQTTQRLTATIASGASNSDSLDISAYGPRGIAVQVGSAWTAADIGFEVSSDDATWYRLRDETGTVIVVTGIQTASASLYVAPSGCWPVGTYEYLRLVSLDTSSGAAVNQGAARTVEVSLLG